MTGAIIEFSARHKVLVLILVAVAAIFGYRSMRNTKLDAIPDLSDTQVIVYSKWDRSPDIVEDQLTYPLTSALLGMPKVKDIRGFSDFGYSYIYIVFDEGTDLYWARSRTLEYLNAITSRLPKDASVELAKDATGVGWVYQYALVDDTGQYSLDQMRSYQDWYLRYALQSLPGVAEVAPIGGFVREYQVQLDPIRMQAYKLSPNAVMDAISKSNNDVGGRLVEFSGREYMVRGRGYLRSLDDIGNIVLLSSAASGTPVRVRDVATLNYGPAMRRGVTDLDGRGEAVGSVVIMRVGENAEKVIERVKEQLALLQPTLPKGLRVVPVYDRSDLIDRAVENLRHTLIEELVIVSLVILIFLWHFPSAIIPIVTIPITILIAFIPLQLSGMTANIMSLGGIAVAIGAMVDAAIVVVEQTHKKLEHWEAGGRKEDYHRVVIDAVKEVGGPSFFALLVIAVSFLPVFSLEAQEGRLFKPLALTKTLAMVLAAVLAITLDPAMRLLMTHVDKFNFRPAWLARITNSILVGEIRSEEEHPISKPLMKIYQPVVEFSLDHKWVPITAALLLMAITIPVYNKLGSEFMPPLDEGTLLYMPSTTPGISVGQAGILLREQDRILHSFPEVLSVFGKAGRAESATDPAPLSMMETVVVLKPRDQWPVKERWYTHRMPQWTQSFLRRIWDDRPATNELVYGMGGMNEALTMPGVSNAWTMPIKGRIDMLTTGVRTPLGVKIMGNDLEEIEHIGHEMEQALHSVGGTASVFAERTAGGYFLDFTFKRDALARYGLTLDDAESVLMSAVGGSTATTTIEGRERYAVTVRDQRGYRSDLQSLERVQVQMPNGTQVPLGELATLSMRSGPGMIRDEDGRLCGYVFIDVAGRDIGSYVEEAQRVVANKVHVPTGYQLVWSGQYESIQRVRERLKMVLPFTLFAVFLLLYANTGSVAKTSIILLAVPFSGIGAIWLLHWMGYNMSVAVWVGLIALLGVDAETAVFMLLYLDLSCNEAAARGQLSTPRQLRDAIEHGAVKRLRPKVMTVACMLFGLLPILWSNGTGADVMKRIAVPLVGGIVTSFLMELVVYPPLFSIWKWNWELRPAIRRAAAISKETNLQPINATSNLPQGEN
jgi:copper/silver efflux system protein